MARNRKTDCWSASVRISIPIDATKPETIAQAQQKVRELATLIPGSAVEIMHAGFGRMIVDPKPMTPMLSIQQAIDQALANPNGEADDLRPPQFLMR